MEEQAYQITNQNYETEKSELIPGRNKRRVQRKIKNKTKGKKKYGYK